MNFEAISIPDDFAGEVRLFPLPGVVCFPSNVVPLHIFESRYRDMVADALEGDHLLAMATLTEGYEPDYHGRPPISPYVCVGKIANHRLNEDGTYDMAFVGLRRAKMDHEVEPVMSFRRGQVDLLQEVACDDSSPQCLQLADELMNEIRPLLPAIDSVSQQFPRKAIPLDALTDIIAFHHEFDNETKLELLGQNDPVRRARRILVSLASTDRPSTADGFPPLFSEN